MGQPLPFHDPISPFRSDRPRSATLQARGRAARLSRRYERSRHRRQVEQLRQPLGRPRDPSRKASEYRDFVVVDFKARSRRGRRARPTFLFRRAARAADHLLESRPPASFIEASRAARRASAPAAQKVVEVCHVFPEEYGSRAPPRRPSLPSIESTPSASQGQAAARATPTTSRTEAAAPSTRSPICAKEHRVAHREGPNELKI